MVPSAVFLSFVEPNHREVNVLFRCIYLLQTYHTFMDISCWLCSFCFVRVVFRLFISSFWEAIHFIFVVCCSLRRASLDPYCHHCQCCFFCWHALVLLHRFSFNSMKFSFSWFLSNVSFFYLFKVFLSITLFIFSVLRLLHLCTFNLISFESIVYFIWTFHRLILVSIEFGYWMQ